MVGRGGRAHPGDRGRDPAGAELPDQRARGPRPLLRRQEQPVWTHGVLQVGIVYRVISFWYLTTKGDQRSWTRKVSDLFYK